MRNKTFSDFMNSISDEKLEKIRMERIQRILSTPESWYLGYMVGDVISRRLPILSISGIAGNVLIQIGEYDYYKQLEDKWFNEKNETIKDNLWKELSEYGNKLDEKYLPKEFKTRINVMNIQNMKDFKEGILNSLWDSDFCNYNIKTNDDIQIEINEDYHFMEITLHR
jgi:hypothetical protein